ncbi:hypothetical protein HY627_02505 [Candidatus Uhrbacteria bacterium]|nr:hypothetical protein [Candidatus Uhrbacteria bacterium]
MLFVNVTIDPSVASSVQNFANPSWDTFLVLFFVTAAIIYAFFVSRERLAVVLLSTYSSLAIVGGTPIIATLLKGYEDAHFFGAKLGVFIALFLLLYVLFSRNMTLHSEIGHRWWQAVMLSILQVGLLISSILSFIPHDVFSSDLSRSLFTSDTARSAWLLAPIAAMLLMRNKHHQSPGPRPL